MTKSEIKIADAVFDPEFWRGISPNLTVGGELNSYALELSEEERLKNQEKIIREGYTHLIAPGLESPIDDMAEAFTAIVERGLPPVFAFVYDELWMLNTQLRNILSHLLDENYYQLPDFWAWLVTKGQSGWAPHRDKPRGGSLERDLPNSITVWIPITHAHPLNSCIYVLPADRDEMYGIHNPSEKFPGQLSDIRALPADPGDVLIWAQQVLHWGARSADEHDLPPRMNVAFEYQRSDIPAYNQPLLDPHQLLSFEHRLALIARMVMQYRSMYSYTDELVSIARKLNSKLELPGPLLRYLLSQR